MRSELPPNLEIPDQPRRLRFYRFQWIGLPMLFAVPLLAILGVFGDARESARDASGTLSLSAEYSTRFRYKQVRDLRVEVRNVSLARLDSVVVRFDPAYLLGFALPAFMPEPARPFEVELLNIDPGETRLIRIELEGQKSGRQTGVVSARPAGTPDSVGVWLRTFIYP